MSKLHRDQCEVKHKTYNLQRVDYLLITYLENS